MHADMETVDAVQARLAAEEATPIAVGSGTINDLVKLAAQRLGRRYMVVATAASMDGYAAFGASITHEGSKQTFDCAAPGALLADMEVIARAPAEMAAAGFGDLAAKLPAGADWIVADALGIETIDSQAWQLVQTPLRKWLSDPVGVRQGDHVALRGLLEGLVQSGLAMQVTQNSRPASGAEHQFSHLWDMEGHTHNGRPVPHGCKVAIGAMTSCAMYEALLEMPLQEMDVAAVASGCPTPAQTEQMIGKLHGPGPLREKAMLEMRAKQSTPMQLRERLSRLRDIWPSLRRKLRAHLLPVDELRRMLESAGTPTRCEQIGITPERMRVSCYRAWTIRRRYTILDLAHECGRFDMLVDRALQDVCR